MALFSDHQDGIHNIFYPSKRSKVVKEISMPTVVNSLEESAAFEEKPSVFAIPNSITYRYIISAAVILACIFFACYAICICTSYFLLL